MNILNNSNIIHIFQYRDMPVMFKISIIKNLKNVVRKITMKTLIFCYFWHKIQY